MKDWKTNWQDILRNTNSTNREKGYMKSNAGKGAYEGVWKKGDEVVEVVWARREDSEWNEVTNEYGGHEQSEVELMIVNVLNHSMIVLKGLKGEELNEMDLSELIENEIVDLNDDGRRWEGEVLKGDLFGYGCLYDEENELEYEGWMIERKKRCYGIEYWNDIGLKKYCGCYYDGLKNGYGLLYDRNGMIEYEGLFKDDLRVTVVAAENRRIEWKGESDLSMDCRTEYLTIADDFMPYQQLMIINCPLMKLKQIKIGNNCLKKAVRLVIDGLNALKSLKIGKNSFELDDGITEESRCVKVHCDELSVIHIGENSFFWYEHMELKDLPSLVSIRFDDHVLEYIHSIVFEDLPDLQTVSIGEYTLAGDDYARDTNVFIMKNLPSLSSFKGDGYNLNCIGKVILDDIPSLTQDGSPLNGLFATVNELSDHPFEYVVEKDKTDRIQLPHPPVLKISRFCELDLINSTIEVLVIQREVGGKHTIFSLGNMPVLVSLSMKFAAFMNCRTIEFYNLFRLRSITLAYEALQGDFDTLDTNTLRLLSTNDNDD
ncbi:hypothetical protein WA171_003868 [Blastocystis sp. BT1]